MRKIIKNILVTIGLSIIVPAIMALAAVVFIGICYLINPNTAEWDAGGVVTLFLVVMMGVVTFVKYVILKF